MCLTNCQSCKYFDRQPHHSTDIVCSLNPAYASMWQRLNTLDEYTLNSLPVDDCREFELNPKLESKTISLYLSLNTWQTLARESSNKIVQDALKNTLKDLLIEIELSLTIEQWQAIADQNTDPVVNWVLEAQGFHSQQESWIDVDSSCINAITYRQSESTLKIRFLRGAIYQYESVPYQLYSDLLDAESKGSFFNTYIKDAFPYRCIRSA